jgi:hypothetical protein
MSEMKEGARRMIGLIEGGSISITNLIKKKFVSPISSKPRPNYTLLKKSFFLNTPKSLTYFRIL